MRFNTSGRTSLRRRRLLQAGVTGVALPAAIFSPDARAHGDHSDPHELVRSADTVTVVGPWELTGLDPSRAGYMFTRMEVTETLLDVDDAGTLLPALATAWSVSADQLQWRFSLRSNSLYHDGTPVTPRSVLNALTRALARPGVLKLADIRAMQIEGRELVVTLGRRFAPLPYLFTHSGTQILAPSSFDAQGNVTGIVGSGRYRIGSIALPQQFDVERFDEYAGGRLPLPQIKKARYLSVSRAETRTLLVQSGQADLAFSLDPPSIRRLQNSRTTQLVSAMLPRTTYIKLNAGHPFLKDARVRLAISLSVERKGIATALLRDADLGATQLFPPAMQQWHQTTLAPLRTDLAAARALLRQAGWIPGADGIARRDGQRFELRLLTFVDRPELPLIAAALQEEMRQIGIAVRVVIGNSSDIPAGHRSGALEMGLTARNFGNLPEPVATLLQDFGPQGADWGAMNWSDPQVVAALNRLADSAGQPQQDRALVAATLQRELPVIPVVWYRQTVAVSQRLRGAGIDPFERSYRISQLEWAR
ncbi:ABC transporter substrate-binding protein [Herbaspirillum lusitanum]|uniref:ABC transporter substrate-binding protein n=1 Tax=Herbaspirillum lusitanum TaxID=213312 RepID=A0ABW9A8B0_9BURK